jgi:NTE family protein
LALSWRDFTFFAAWQRGASIDAMQHSVLQCSNDLSTLVELPADSPSRTPDVMIPLLLNKALSTLWRPRRPAGAGRSRHRQGGGKSINLALQGGGAHGAFTWGVLDQLLADGRLVIDGISGTSAGAVNAVMLADGLLRGGPEEAQRRLGDFWRAASLGGGLPDLQRGVVERLFSFIPSAGAAPPWFRALSPVWSPYDLNPLNINPLKELIERFVDFELLRSDSTHDLFVCATNVRTGEPRVFKREEMTAEAVMASACIPLLFRAVEIDGEPYWDGGYSGNPTLSPFLHSTTTEDLLIVQINPRDRRKSPASAREIVGRANEITFNAALLAELRMIEFVGRLIDEGRLPHGAGPGEYRRIRLHRVVLDEFGDSLDSRSKLRNDYESFESLHKLGQRAMRRFLDAHFDDIGRRGTLDAAAPPIAEVA